MAAGYVVPMAERFWKHVKKSKHGCWLWQGRLHSAGYGQVWDKSFACHFRLAHRVAYELTHGSVPDGVEVCHSCDTPACVRPSHLFLGTHDDNMKDAGHKARLPWGERQHQAKLTVSDVASIRLLATTATQASLAAKYGVTPSVISRIVAGKAWKHVA